MNKLIRLCTVATVCFLTGCAGVRGTVRTTIDVQTPDGRKFAVSNPKDLVIQSLEIDPKTGRYKLVGLRSSANEAAIEAAKAEAVSRAEVWMRGFDLLDKLSDRAAQAYGVPVKSGDATVPAGMKWVLVPKDDPSTAKPELDATK